MKLRPKILWWLAPLAIVIGVIVLAHMSAAEQKAGGHPSQTGVMPTPKTCWADAITPADIVSKSNAERVKAGLAPLSENTTLTTAAKAKAYDMVAQHYWAHNAPDGKTPFTWIKSSGYNYVYAGENLAKDYSSTDKLIAGWLNSSEHRANLLSGNYFDTGVAVLCGAVDNNTTLIVAFYGSPQPVLGQAVCVDGTVSQSTGSGTCSWHGGIRYSQ